MQAVSAKLLVAAWAVRLDCAGTAAALVRPAATCLQACAIYSRAWRLQERQRRHKFIHFPSLTQPDSMSRLTACWPQVSAHVS